MPITVSVMMRNQTEISGRVIPATPSLDTLAVLQVNVEELNDFHFHIQDPYFLWKLSRECEVLAETLEKSIAYEEYVAEIYPEKPIPRDDWIAMKE